MRYINLTPHEIALYRLDGKDVLGVWPAHKPALRLEETDTRVVGSWIHTFVPGHEVGPGKPGLRLFDEKCWDPTENYCMHVPVVTRTLEATDLPPAKPETVYIVSLPALMGLRAAGCTRTDFVAPDTGSGPYGAVRNDQGQVIGCRRLVYLPAADGAPFTPDDSTWVGESPAKWAAANPVRW